MLFLFAHLACDPGAPADVDPSGPTDETGAPSTESTDPTEPTEPTTPTTPEPTPTTLPHDGTATACFADQWGAAPPVDYDQFGPTVAAHCHGTDHQDIAYVERVVYVGDSIAVGTPPTGAASWWRNQTADAIATRFGLQAPGPEWRNVSLVDGVALETFSGDFASCAKWGARTDDLLQPPHEQFLACMPEEDRDLRTLVLMTIGGNDIFSLLEDRNAGVDEATMRANHAAAVARVREAVDWLLAPDTFPNGVYLVFANTYDLTDPDAAEDMARCEGAALIGLDDALRDPVIQDILAEAQEAYVQIATETRTDLVFLGEQFCGHGHDRDNADGRCWRGPGAALYYDLTCEHPNAAGHDAITQAMLETIAQ